VAKKRGAKKGKKSPQKRQYSAKETCTFKEPTNRHSICLSVLSYGVEKEKERKKEEKSGMICRISSLL